MPAIALVLVIGIASAPLLTQNVFGGFAGEVPCRRRNGSRCRTSRRRR
jgi:hypothetical protein